MATSRILPILSGCCSETEVSEQLYSTIFVFLFNKWREQGDNPLKVCVIMYLQYYFTHTQHES
jgi:hypothetical protein